MSNEVTLNFIGKENVMNSGNLQRHLEERLVILIKACADEQAQDDGLILTIITDPLLTDQSRLNYISQIENRLPARGGQKFSPEWSFNTRYPENDPESEERHWANAARIAREIEPVETSVLESKDCVRLMQVFDAQADSQL